MKRLVVMVAPFSTRSGYGDHARSIFYSIMDRDDIDVKCIDVKWGSTPRNHLRPEVPRHKKLLDAFVNQQQIKQQPDVYIDIRIPNEFGGGGKVNIGITAGMETTLISPEWIEGCNRMDLIIVPSEHCKRTFQSSRWDKHDERTKQKIGELKVEPPVEVLFEGAHEEIYKLTKNIPTELNDDLNSIKEPNIRPTNSWYPANNSYVAKPPIFELAKRYVFVYAKLNGSKIDPPSPPPLLEPIVRLCILRTSTTSSGRIYSF